MLVNVVTFTFPAEQSDRVAGMLAELAALSRLESGCLGFEACRSNDDPRTFVLFERWADAAALEAHYATEHVTGLRVNGIRPLAESRVAHKCTPAIA